jgi:16S rRNA A1518/A1519 N6-dimethyltransferase RsmA/KsgA/DIM1 with predicted DNA glycosylase/AP lyase activity
MHHNSLLIFKKYAAVHFQENAKVLEIGAGKAYLDGVAHA